MQGRLAPSSAPAIVLFVGLVSARRGLLETVVYDSLSLRKALNRIHCLRRDDDFRLDIFHRFHLLPDVSFPQLRELIREIAAAKTTHTMFATRWA